MTSARAETAAARHAPLEVGSESRKGASGTAAKRHHRVKPGRFLAYAIVSVVCVVVAIPAVLVLLTSFKPLVDIYKTGPLGLDPVPSRWTLANYKQVFSQYGADFWRWSINSAIYAGAYSAFGVLTALCGAYALIRYHLRARRVALACVVLTLMVPAQVTFIPLFQAFTSVHLVNSYGGLLLPGVASAFAFYLLYQFLLALPAELYDAAVIDGAGDLRIISRVVVPLARSGLSALAIILFVGAWNDYFWPLVITNNQSLYTLVVGLATVQGTGASWTNPGEVIAFGMLLMLPVTVVYGFLQRHVVSGITSTGFK